MYAIIQDGGHQYKVEAGKTCRVQLKEVEAGNALTFEKVAFVGGDLIKVGSPYIPGATVKATVVRHVKGPKLIIGFYRRRKNSRRRVGHRQQYTEVKIDTINL